MPRFTFLCRYEFVVFILAIVILPVWPCFCKWVGRFGIFFMLAFYAIVILASLRGRKLAGLNLSLSSQPGGAWL